MTSGDKKHSPLPWKVLDLKPPPPAISIGGSENTGAIATMWGRFCLGDERQANAEFIVRACNSHYELLEALKRLRAFTGALMQETGKTQNQNVLTHSDIAIHAADPSTLAPKKGAIEVAKQLNAAIAKAEDK